MCFSIQRVTCDVIYFAGWPENKSTPPKNEENQPAKQDPSLEAIFKWMYVVIVHGATNFIIALSRAKHNPSVWIFDFSQKEKKSVFHKTERFKSSPKLTSLLP